MKRALTVAMLLLMIVTSLSAGTLAVYTSTVDLAVLAVSAKRFSLQVGQGSQSEFDLKIGPGEMVNYYFDVANTNEEGSVAEVAMDLFIQGDFSAVYDAIPGISAQLLIYSGDGYVQVSEAGGSGTLSYSKLPMFQAGKAEVEHFILSFQWEDGESARQLIASQQIILPLTLYVRGTQHVD